MHFQRLPVASKALAPMLWLLASESNNGEIRKTTEEIAFRLRMLEKDVVNAIKPLIDNGFFIDADNVLAECLQDATTEREIEREREKERKKEIDTPSGVSDSIFKDYLEVRKAKKAKWTETALKGLQREADKAKMTLEQVMQLCCERNWVGFKAEWANSQNPVSQNKDDKQWMFSNEGIVAKANELGLRSEGLSYQQLKDKCLYVMTNKALQ